METPTKVSKYGINMESMGIAVKIGINMYTLIVLEMGNFTWLCLVNFQSNTCATHAIT